MALELLVTIIGAQADVRPIHRFFETSHLTLVLHTGRKLISDDSRFCRAAEDDL